MTFSPIKTLGALLLLTSSVLAQTAPQQYDTVPMSMDSGYVANTGRQPEVIISFPVQMAGSSWLRLYFEEVDLAGDVFAGDGAILRITSWLDGDIQELNARHVDQWQKSTAYMNGDTVQVEVLAYPGTGTSRLKLRAVDAGHSTIQESQCGSQDNRTASTDPRAARLLPVGCTGWLINDCSHCLLTAGHCTGNIGVVQFNVPLSNGNGSLNNPPASDQYAVDATSLQTNGGQGVGNDWGYFGTFPNPNTGLTAAQAQGAFYILGTPPNSTSGNDIRITGYGVDSGTANQTLQTHVGPLVNISGNSIGYVTDTTGGNSGSPVIHEQTGDAVGIHTHGGCSTTGGGNNWGTKTTHSALQSALANPAGVCASGGIEQAGFVPELIPPGVPTTLFMSMSGAPVTSTQVLHYRSSSASLFSTVAMTDIGNGLYEADLPGMACGDLPEYYFSGQDNGCGLVTVPENAPQDVFTVEVGNEVLTFADNFETDQGWTTSSVNATAGFWERGAPVNDPNTANDPLADGDNSGQCFVTGNTLGNSDVDNGSVRLISPVLDFSGSGKNLFYSYFLSLSLPNGTDRLGVSMSDSGPTGPWITVALHEDNNGLDWTHEVITEAQILATGLTFTTDMHVRFIARDLGTGTTVEAGVDAVKVGEVTCGTGPIGSTYCSPAVNNSTGQSATIAASGSAQAAANDVTLLASNLPTNQFGFFLNSVMQGFAANPGGSQGNLCLGGSIGRYNTPVLNTGALGSMTLVLDLTNTPTPTGSVSILAGQTWNFQAWYRDVNPTATTNFTDAVSIDFQ